MLDTTVLIAIRQTVLAYLPDSRIVLFGSRARSDFDDHSDYDLLIITPDKLSSHKKIALNTNLNKAIVNSVKIPVDLLINSEEEVRQKMELPGHIIRSAIKEGLFLYH